jgi:hypothetical protein
VGALLRRKHIDISAGLIRVEATVAELANGAGTGQQAARE